MPLRVLKRVCNYRVDYYLCDIIFGWVSVMHAQFADKWKEKVLAE